MMHLDNVGKVSIIARARYTLGINGGIIDGLIEGCNVVKAKMKMKPNTAYHKANAYQDSKQTILGFAAMGLVATTVAFSMMVGQALAREDGPIIIPQKPATEQPQENTSTAVSETAVDLTDLIKSIEDNDTAETTPDEDTAASSEPSADNNSAAVNTASPSLSISTGGGLKKKDPSSIRLASIGREREDHDGLDRLMWEGSSAETIMMLKARLGASPSALQPAIYHIMAARSLPPKGFVDVAPSMISLRLDWLAANGKSDDLAELVRQLPEQDVWTSWKEWLALHDLLTRNDADACAVAAKNTMLTLEPLWHQINAFCAVVSGDEIKASFALDILEDSGVDDDAYFSLMRQLTDGAAIDANEIDQSNLDVLHLVLMDSARITIAAEALSGVPSAFDQSIKSLRYLSPEANRVLAARQFGAVPVDELLASWALAPTTDIASSEALTRLRFGGDEDEVLMARLNAWQAISAEKDDRTQAQLALEALMADYNFAQIGALDIWQNFIEGGADDLALEDKLGPLLGFAENPSKVLLNDSALLWHDILTFSPRPTPAQVFAQADAFDVMPLLLAIGQRVDEPNWLEVDDQTSLAGAPSLTGENALPYASLKAIEASAEKGLKAETLLRIAVVLNDKRLADLTRDDAAQVTAALYKLGLEQTAKDLARDILKSWGMSRHVESLTSPSQEASSEGAS